MATESQKMVAADNCCSGSCSRRLVELASENAAIREIIAPTGVEMIARAVAAGMGVSADNCCSGSLGARSAGEMSHPM